MTVCIRKNSYNSITLNYMKNTNILIYGRVNIPIFHIMVSKFMSSSINIFVFYPYEYSF